MNTFTFSGRSSDSFGAYVFDKDTSGAPKRAYDEITIPGKDGIMYMDGKRYENHKHVYDVIINENFTERYAALRGFMLSQIGYKRLEDTFHPDEFYKAIYLNDFVMTLTNNRDMGKIKLEFERKPQRYLKSGEETITITDSEYWLDNPTGFDARPLLRVYGAGVLGIGDNAITILSADEYTDIDCETMEAYKGTQSCNERIKIQNIDFPVLSAGEIGITLGEGITQVDLTPRWWRL